MSEPITETLTTPGEKPRKIAVLRRPGDGPCVVWLGGFRSEMTATKATALDDWAARNGRAALRFDYSGHGASSENFEDGTIGDWLEDALTAIAHAGPSPVLVGSSMGGWIALLAARRMPTPPSGLVLIAPAVDFTKSLMWDAFSQKVRDEIERTGRWMRPTDYAPEPYPVTRRLIEEGRNHLMLDGPITAGAPVRILQGLRDPDVPWPHTQKLLGKLTDEDVVVTLIKDGDHRLSREQDIALLLEAVDGVTRRR